MKRLCSGLIAALVALSGCGIGAGANDQREAGEADLPGGTVDDLAMTEDSFGGELRLGIERPTNFLPASVVLTDQSAVIVADLLYDGLTEAVGRQGTLRPGLALDWWPNEDFTRWTFRLDENSGVTAEAVVHSLLPLTGGETGGADKPGVAAVLAADVRAVSAIDELTVAVDLRSANAGLPWVVSGLPFSIVGPDGIPTGDFEIIADDTNGVILGRRPGRRSDQPDELERVVVTWVNDGDQAQELLERRRMHAVVSPELSTQPTEPALSVATAATRFYVLNTRSPALTEVEVRLAVLAAVDRNDLDLGDSDQHLVPADGLVGADLAGYRSNACGPACRHDPTLAANNAPDRIQLSYAGEEQSTTAAAIVEQFRAAGVDAEQHRLTPEELASVIVDGRTDMFAFGWVAAATSIDAVIPPLLTVDSPANVARVDSPTVAALLDQAAVTVDDGRRWDILDQAQRAALDEGLMLPVAASASMLYQPLGSPTLVVRADGSLDLETSR